MSGSDQLRSALFETDFKKIKKESAMIRGYGGCKFMRGIDREGGVAGYRGGRDGRLLRRVSRQRAAAPLSPFSFPVAAGILVLCFPFLRMRQASDADNLADPFVQC